MFVLHHTPSAALTPYVQDMIYYRGYNPGAPFIRTLPDGVVQLLIFLDAHDRRISPEDHKHTFSPICVTGLQRIQTTYRADFDGEAVCIRFTTGGLYSLTHLPQTELEDAIVDADLIFGPSINNLREQVLNRKQDADIFTIVENFLLQRLPTPGTEQAVIHYMHCHIHQPLAQLVQKTGYSQKHVIQLFKKHVGVSPKYFQRIQRFYQCLWDICSTTRPDWQDVVHNNGYFDQPHFIKEFSHFAGISPLQYHQKLNGGFPIFVPMHESGR